MKIKDMKYSEEEMLNQLTFLDYSKRLTLYAISLFEWVNLPDGISERYLETMLYECGYIIFFKDKYENLGGHMVAQATPYGNLNYYNEPTAYMTNNFGYQGKLYNMDECVLIRDNYLMLPPSDTVFLYANRLTNLERTIDVNVEAQKTPFMIPMADNQKLTFDNIMKQYHENVTTIKVSKSLDVSQFKVLNTLAPFVADKLEMQLHNKLNDVLSFLGVNNANTDKKERLITDEVQSNEQLIALSMQTRLLSRQQACKQINKMFGLNVDVKVRDLELIPTSEGGEDIE